jgi:hypothetical protein
MPTKVFTSIKIWLAGAAILICWAQPSLAHTLETHSTVGALFHIDPNDEPIAGQPATIYIELQDKSAKLTPANCNCKLVISLQDKEIFNDFLFKNDAASLATQVPFVFPKAGVYTVSIEGEPAAEIEPFDLDYETQVKLNTSLAATNEPGASKPYDHTTHYIVFGAGGLVVLGYLAYTLKKKKL